MPQREEDYTMHTAYVHNEISTFACGYNNEKSWVNSSIKFLPNFRENLHDFRSRFVFQDAGCVHDPTEWTPLHTNTSKALKCDFPKFRRFTLTNYHLAN
jgi:hypothetical protein